MIFYFSGTGNTRWVAYRLANLLQEQVVSIAQEMHANDRHSTEYQLTKGERVGFVFPVHSWGTPQIVLDFISQLQLQLESNTYLYFVCTHGDDAGYTRQITEKALLQRGYSLASAFSVTMPNNYVCFPGFDVDDAHLRNNKLRNAENVCKQIAKQIEDKRKDVFTIHEGKCAWLKSRIVYPLFVKYGLSDKSFHTLNSCISCGKCASVCPTKNIKLNNAKPIWNGHCTQCLACYHVCPTHAIHYGSVTRKKGQYWHDNYVQYD